MHYRIYTVYTIHNIHFAFRVPTLNEPPNWIFSIQHVINSIQHNTTQHKKLKIPVWFMFLHSFFGGGCGVNSFALFLCFCFVCLFVALLMSILLLHCLFYLFILYGFLAVVRRIHAGLLLFCFCKFCD